MELLSSSSMNSHSSPQNVCQERETSASERPEGALLQKAEGGGETSVFIDPGLMNELEFNIFINQFIQNKDDLLLIIKHIINSYNPRLIEDLNQIMFDAKTDNRHERGPDCADECFHAYNRAFKKIKSLIPFLQKHVLYKTAVLKQSYIFSARALSVFGETQKMSGSGMMQRSLFHRPDIRFTLSNWIKFNPELFETEILMFKFFFNICGNYIKKNVSAYSLENFFQTTFNPVYIITTKDKMKMLNSIIINYDSLRFI
jgi:hypothetical protein